MSTIKRFTGTLLTLDEGKHCGFIGLKSVSANDGSSHGLATSKDIFVHQDDCESPLRGGMELTFEVVSDDRRLGDALRAVDVVELVTGELVLAGVEAGGRALADPAQLYVPPTPAQCLAKWVPQADVERVLANRPMAQVPRAVAHKIDRAEAATITRELLERLFPHFKAYGVDFTTSEKDREFDQAVSAAIVSYQKLQMDSQVRLVQQQVRTFKSVRTALESASEDGVIRPDTLIPIKYLHDLFMAVPVWYFCPRAKGHVVNKNELNWFMEQFPNRRWYDTFQMYNYWPRMLQDYLGDLMPPKVMQQVQKFAPIFDYLVVMTPYHDVVGSEWQNPVWTRSVDPYLVGFAKGLPFMVVLARFSDSGVFPLFPELVADTLAFIRANHEKLIGFNKVEEWYNGPNMKSFGEKLGPRLIKNAKELLVAFDAKVGFDWLRGEGHVPVRS